MALEEPEDSDDIDPFAEDGHVTLKYRAVSTSRLSLLKWAANTDLAREPLLLICLFSHHSTVSRIKPNRDRAPVPEPFGMDGEVFGFQTDYGSNDLDSVGGLGVRTEEIVLGEVAHEPVASEDKRQRLDDRCLAAVVRSDQNRTVAKLHLPGPDAPKVLDLKKCNLHVPSR